MNKLPAVPFGSQVGADPADSPRGDGDKVQLYAADSDAIRFCLGCMDERDYEIATAVDTAGRAHSYGGLSPKRGTWPIAPDALRALVAVARAAMRIRVYDDAGGNEWWEAHARLYLALEAFDPDCGVTLAHAYEDFRRHENGGTTS